MLMNDHGDEDISCIGPNWHIMPRIVCFTGITSKMQDNTPNPGGTTIVSKEC